MKVTWDWNCVDLQTMGQVDTSKALDFVWLGWMLMGVYPIQSYKIWHTCHLILAVSATNIYSLIVFITQLFYVKDLKYLLDNLPMNVLIIATTLKFLTVFLTRHEILGIKDSLSKLDKRPLKRSQAENLANLIKFCNRLFIFGFICYEAVDVMAAVNAGFSNRQHLLFEIWLPYDWQATATRYWLTFLYQFITQSALALQSVSSDFSGPIYLMILTAHLENVMARVESLKYDPRKEERENVKELIQCIEDHRVVLK